MHCPSNAQTNTSPICGGTVCMFDTTLVHLREHTCAQEFVRTNHGFYPSEMKIQGTTVGGHANFHPKKIKSLDFHSATYSNYGCRNSICINATRLNRRASSIWFAYNFATDTGYGTRDWA